MPDAILIRKTNGITRDNMCIRIEKTWDEYLPPMHSASSDKPWLPRPHLVHTLVEEGQAGVLIADKGALLDEADEQLGLGHQGVELVMRSVTALEESLPEIV